MFGRCHRRLQDRAGEPADRSRDMLKLARPCRPSLASTRSWGVLKETKKATSISPGTEGSISASSPPGPDTANGRGFAVRVQSDRSIRPLVFDVGTPRAGRESAHSYMRSVGRISYGRSVVGAVTD